MHGKSGMNRVYRSIEGDWAIQCTIAYRGTKVHLGSMGQEVHNDVYKRKVHIQCVNSDGFRGSSGQYKDSSSFL